MTDDEILAAADRIKAERREAKKRTYVLTKGEVAGRTRERMKEVGHRCLDGGETYASAARSMGLASAAVRLLAGRESRERKRLAGIPPALSGEERQAIAQGGITGRLFYLLANNNLIPGDAYMTASESELLRIPNFGRKTLNELLWFRRQSEAFRSFLLGKNRG